MAQLRVNVQLHIWWRHVQLVGTLPAMLHWAQDPSWAE